MRGGLARLLVDRRAACVKEKSLQLIGVIFLAYRGGAMRNRLVWRHLGVARSARLELCAKIYAHL